MRKSLALLIVVVACLLPITAMAADFTNETTINVQEDLDGSWSATRLQNTNFGNLITDGYRQATGADVAIESAQFITGSLNKGMVTGEALKNCLSNSGSYKVVSITGSELWVMLERSLGIMKDNESKANVNPDEWGEDASKCLQFSGAKVYYDDTETTGSRITIVNIDNKPIEEDDLYTVAFVEGHIDLAYYIELSEGKTETLEGRSDAAVYEQMLEESNWSDINQQRYVSTEVEKPEGPKINFMTSVIASFGVIMIGVLIGWFMGRKRYKKK